MKDIEIEIQSVINKIRPYIQRDGGDLEYVAFENGIVYVRMLGACRDCFMQDDTIKDGVEALLLEEIREVEKVQVIQD